MTFHCKICKTPVSVFLTGRIFFELELHEMDEENGIFKVSFQKEGRPYLDAEHLLIRCPSCLHTINPAFSLKEASEYHKNFTGRRLQVKTDIRTMNLFHGDKIQLPIKQINKWSKVSSCKKLNSSEARPKLIRRHELKHDNS